MAEGEAHGIDLARQAYVVIWEITRACALACRHCRASAQRRRDPRELTTAEGYALIDQIAVWGVPILVLTGGDPLLRPDCFELIAYGNSRGVGVSFSPSATARLDRTALRRARDAGLRRIALSLDGSTAAVHDAFRQVRGVYTRTLRAIREAQEMGLSVQLHTTVSRHNLADLPALAELVSALRPVLWSLFFLVPTGRARVTDMLDAAEHEQVLTWLCALREQVPFDVKTTEAPYFRRLLLQRGAALRRPAPDGLARPTAAINDGKGFCFVSHVGEVCPSGFLPLAAGNVRQTPLPVLYQQSPLFRALRDPTRLRGKCGLCEFREVCGGSRAKAYALTGDYLAADPCCAYRPSQATTERAACSV
ncbi:MAG TPA: TIGR04053 family radical SAM/SPASM domain-containing protein [Chloroflexota bacterium]|nr:TIGR04053 family radical SAM/SPASM domain-containing protein [Chloroflexota bacterium]